MPSIVPKVRFSVKEQLLRQLRRCRAAGVRTRYLIIINLLNGRSAYETADVLGIHNTTVYRVAKRFCHYQEAGLWDAREDNGSEKLSEAYLGTFTRWCVVRRWTTAGGGQLGRGNCWWQPWSDRQEHALP
jgi:hypothetical protein